MISGSLRERSKKLSILLNTIHRRVFRIGPMFVLARFRSCRVAYSYSQRVRQSADRRRHQTPQSMFQPQSESLFKAIVADRSVEELRRDGISLHFDLPPALVNEIYDLACTLPLQNSVLSGPFLKSEVTAGGRLPDGQLVSLGTAYKSRKLQLLKHECVSRVVNDPVLLNVVSSYLGYWPKRLSDLELYWSFATGLSVEEQMRQGNAIDYHFDLHGYNFVMAAFYITDTDRTSGAHAMFKNSHKKKTLPMLFSYSQPADVLRRHYGSENETIIEGKAGTGFVMDNSTYHRATTPESADRLLLRLVYT